MADLAYAKYWQRKQLLLACPHFPRRRWWPTDGLCEIERTYYEAIAGKASLLDVGAGDLRMMRKFQSAGFRGEYHTQDIGGEYAHTYRDLDEVQRTYDAIVCFDLIEHLPLGDGLTLIHKLLSLLNSSGVLLLQTPNGRCIRSAYGTDMTHLHLYNIPDLWAYLRAEGYEATGYRVPFSQPTSNPIARLKQAISAYLITRLIGADYADNIALIARKPFDHESHE